MKVRVLKSREVGHGANKRGRDNHAFCLYHSHKSDLREVPLTVICVPPATLEKYPLWKHSHSVSLRTLFAITHISKIKGG